MFQEWIDSLSDEELDNLQKSSAPTPMYLDVGIAMNFCQDAHGIFDLIELVNNEEIIDTSDPRFEDPSLDAYDTQYL